MLEQTIKIKSYDVHPNGVVKISALQKYMQQIAREDSDSYGATYAKMRDANMVFVITRLAMEFERPLRDEDIVTIRTINNRLEGASFVREFLFFSGGEQVAAATTLWALLDFEKRSILRPSALPFTIPALKLPVPGIPVQKRLTERGTVLTPSGERQVAFSDLDENNHLNNAYYSDIVADFAPVSLYDHWISGLQIAFLSEARLGDTLAVGVQERESGFLLTARNGRTGANCFEAQATVSAL